MSHSQVQVLPMDEHNTRLVNNVHPPDWQNPTPAGRYNLVVIGAGTGGLVTSIISAGLGAKVALIEKHLMGGDCLNVGCVPSKAILRSAKVMGDINTADQFGINIPAGTTVDFAKAMERLRRVRADISHVDSAARYSDEGIDVFMGEATFTGPHTIDVGGQELTFKKAVVATGSRPFVPPIEGLEDVGYMTNETVFSLTEQPKRIAVIGGGPIGCELAQAFRRLGSEVVLFHNSDHILNREDADAADIVQNVFIREGIKLYLQNRVVKVEQTDTGKLIHFTCPTDTGTVEVDEVLVSTGRVPNVEGIGLEAAGVDYDLRKGIIVNDYMQTTASHIYAAGDVAIPYKFTHLADHTARIVVKNALFHGFGKFSKLVIPWCTYTDPEIAHVGLYPQEAAEQGLEIDTFKVDFDDVDRAITDGETEGFVKVHVKKGTDTILGATIVARTAGDMINEFNIAMVANIGLGTLGNVIHSYPTQSEAIAKVASQYSRTRLTPMVKKLFAGYLSWSR